MSTTVYETYARGQAGVAPIFPAMRKNAWPGSVAYNGPDGSYVGKVADELSAPGKRISVRAGYAIIGSKESAATFRVKTSKFEQITPSFAESLLHIPQHGNQMRVVSRVEPEEPFTWSDSSNFIEFSANNRDRIREPRSAYSGPATVGGGPATMPPPPAATGKRGHSPTEQRRKSF